MPWWPTIGAIEAGGDCDLLHELGRGPSLIPTLERQEFHVDECVEMLGCASDSVQLPCFTVVRLGVG